MTRSPIVGYKARLLSRTTFWFASTGTCCQASNSGGSTADLSFHLLPRHLERRLPGLLLTLTPVCYIAGMRLIYTHPNLLIVGAMRNALDELGIETEIRNDILGGAAGEIAPGETWIELWVVNDEQAPAAMRRIQEIERQPDEEEWDCHHCEEPNPATFELCWQCQTQRQA